MKFGSLVAGLVKLVTIISTVLGQWLAKQEAAKHEEMGRLQKDVDNAQANADALVVISRVDPNSVSDDEAFGPIPSN